jgi:hypothetical protein
VVAGEVGVPLSTVTHTSVSMHIYERDIERSKNVVNSFQNTSYDLPNLPRIDKDSDPLDQVRDLVILEAELRHNSRGIDGNNISTWIDKGNKLHEYWRQFYYLLLLHIVNDNIRNEQSRSSRMHIALDSLRSVIGEPWLSYLPEGTFNIETKAASNVDEVIEMEMSGDGGTKRFTPFHKTQGYRALCTTIEKYEEEFDDNVSWREFGKLEEKFAPKIAHHEEDLTASDIKEEISKIREETN